MSSVGFGQPSEFSRPLMEHSLHKWHNTLLGELSEALGATAELVNNRFIVKVDQHQFSIQLKTETKNVLIFTPIVTCTTKKSFPKIYGAKISLNEIPGHHCNTGTSLAKLVLTCYLAVRTMDYVLAAKNLQSNTTADTPFKTFELVHKNHGAGITLKYDFDDTLAILAVICTLTRDDDEKIYRSYEANNLDLLFSSLDALIAEVIHDYIPLNLLHSDLGLLSVKLEELFEIKSKLSTEGRPSLLLQFTSLGQNFQIVYTTDKATYLLIATQSTNRVYTEQVLEKDIDLLHRLVTYLNGLQRGALAKAAKNQLCVPRDQVLIAVELR